MRGDLGITMLRDPMAVRPDGGYAIDKLRCCLMMAHLLKSGSYLKKNMCFATQLLGFDLEFLRDSSPMVPSASESCEIFWIGFILDSSPLD